MKILYLITKSNWGGAQKYVYDLAVAFNAKGHDICVASGGNGELIEKLKEKGIYTHVFPSLQRDIKIFAEIKSFFDILFFIRRKKPDILHLNSSKAAGLGVVCGRLLGVKNIIVTVHGAPFREDRLFFIRAIIYFFTWVTCLLAHRIIAVSNRDGHDLGRMFFIRKKITTVYNGIPFNGPLVRTREKTRETHIVTIGDLTRNKGHIYGLKAINTLVKKGIPIKYFIEGEGEDRRKLEEFIHMNNLDDIVTLFGRTLTTTERLQDYDIFLLPSVKEGLPYVLLEAGRAMLPVVTTTTGGIPEIVRHEETGLLVQPKNIDQLSDAIERFITDRHFAKKVGSQLHSHVVQNFSHTKMIVETTKVYGLI